MVMNRESLLNRAVEGRRESKYLDFKIGFDINTREGWAEIIKDIVAFANSGGGVLVLGANDDGTPAGVDVTPYLQVDPADLTNKVQAVTGNEFADFEIVEIERQGQRLAAYIIYGAPVPMVFIRDGSHLGEGRARRPAFVKGSVYFRHGAKSEPGTTNDLRNWLERSLDDIRKTWLGGIRQVVEVGAGQQVNVVASDAADQGAINARIGADPDAIPVRPQNAEELWPYREIALIERILPTLPDGVRFNGHDVRCLKLAHDISPETRPDFVFKPHEMASPQYSEEFAQWITDRFVENNQFFEEARQNFRENGNRY